MGYVFPCFYFIVWYDEFIQSSGLVSQFASAHFKLHKNNQVEIFRYFDLIFGVIGLVQVDVNSFWSNSLTDFFNLFLCCEFWK